MLTRRVRGSRDSSVGNRSERDASRGSQSSRSGGKEMVLNFLVSKRKSHQRQQALLSSRQSRDFVERPYTEMQLYNGNALQKSLGLESKAKALQQEMTPTLP